MNKLFKSIVTTAMAVCMIATSSLVAFAAEPTQVSTSSVAECSNDGGATIAPLYVHNTDSACIVNESCSLKSGTQVASVYFAKNVKSVRCQVYGNSKTVTFKATKLDGTVKTFKVRSDGSVQSPDFTATSGNWTISVSSSGGDSSTSARVVLTFSY